MQGELEMGEGEDRSTETRTHAEGEATLSRHTYVGTATPHTLTDLDTPILL